VVDRVSGLDVNDLLRDQIDNRNRVILLQRDECRFAVRRNGGEFRLDVR